MRFFLLLSLFLLNADLVDCSHIQDDRIVMQHDNLILSRDWFLHSCIEWLEVKELETTEKTEIYYLGRKKSGDADLLKKVIFHENSVIIPVSHRGSFKAKKKGSLIKIEGEGVLLVKPTFYFAPSFCQPINHLILSQKGGVFDIEVYLDNDSVDVDLIHDSIIIKAK